ncbi:caveolincaveolin-2-like [Podarcis lilfordi]|uniref:Caveolin n=1 Tax=Podarcis lilfordi TaxID=74358 RepID=A0AA35LGY2_9SAUR|nr:caveolincaveolin-2-like [Podarcis lilfordi]
MINNDYLIECKLDPEDPHLQEPGSPMFLQSAINTPPKADPRDPRGINQHLKLEFSDILAEPSSFRSFDRVWTWSDIVFESSRLWCYRIISLLCAVPVSLFSGFLFACLGCLHIWCVMPCIQLCTMAMPPVRTLWASILDVVVAPLFTSLGRCCSAIYLTVTEK